MKHYRKDRYKQVQDFNSYLETEWWNDEKYSYLPESYRQRIRNNPHANKLIYNPNNVDLTVYENFLKQKEAFDIYNTDIVNEYWDYINSIPTAQIARNRAAGINSDLDGSQGVGAADTQTDVQTQIPDYSLATAQQQRLQQVQLIGSCIVSAINSAMGIVQQVQGYRMNEQQIQQGKTFNSYYPEMLEAQIANIRSGTDVNNTRVPNIVADTENKNANTKVLSEQQKMLQIEQNAATKQLAYTEYNQGINAALRGQNAIEGASADYMRGYNSIIGSEADRVAILERRGKADQLAGLYRGYVDNTLEMTEYQKWYIEAAQNIQRNQFKLEMAMQNAGITSAEYDQKYISALDPTLAAVSQNSAWNAAKEQNTFNQVYFGKLDPTAQAGVDNAALKVQSIVQQVQLSNKQELGKLVSRLIDRSKAKDPIATQALFNMYFGGSIHMNTGTFGQAFSAGANLADMIFSK